MMMVVFKYKMIWLIKWKWKEVIRTKNVPKNKYHALIKMEMHMEDEWLKSHMNWNLHNGFPPPFLVTNKH